MIKNQLNPNFSRLLPYYQEEMAYLLKAGQEFSKSYPSVAQGLDLSAKGSSDPHVQRLIESFAFLSGRLQLEIEDQYSFLSEALLEVLYPQFIRPTPPCTVFKLSPKASQAQQLAGKIVPRGAEASTVSNEGIKCHFQTTMDTAIWPLEVTDVGYEHVQYYDLPPSATPASSLLRVKIESTAGAVNKLPLDQLTLHLGGNLLSALTLFRWLHTALPHKNVPIFIQTDPAGPLTRMPEEAFGRVGFAPDEALILNMAKTAPAYQLLWEYFVFPQKFLFFNVNGLKPFIKEAQGKSFTLFFGLGPNVVTESWPLDKNSIQTNCAPAINLFYKTAEPIRFDHKKSRYRLVPDQRLESSTEVHSILKVSSAVNMKTPATVYEPYFSYTHKEQKNKQSCFWLSSRSHTTLPHTSGTDTFLSFVDFHMALSDPSEKTVYAHTLSTNRNLAEKIAVNTRFYFQGDFAAISATNLERPTRAIMPILDGAMHWNLINHLSVDFLGLCATDQSIEPLKAILSLYNWGHKSMSAIADALQTLTIEQTVGRIGIEAWRGFVPMLSVTLGVDDKRANTQGFFLLCMILKEFFKLSAGFDTLVETQAVGLGGHLIKQWKPEECIANSL